MLVDSAPSGRGCRSPLQAEPAGRHTCHVGHAEVEGRRGGGAGGGARPGGPGTPAGRRAPWPWRARAPCTERPPAAGAPPAPPPGPAPHPPWLPPTPSEVLLALPAGSCLQLQADNHRPPLLQAPSHFDVWLWLAGQAARLHGWGWRQGGPSVLQGGHCCRAARARERERERERERTYIRRADTASDIIYLNIYMAEPTEGE